MARIAGINIPPHKHTEIGLTSIYGIGRTTAQKICTKSGVPFDRKVKDLTDADLEKIRSISDVAESHFKSRTLDTTFHAGFEIGRAHV